MTSINSLIVPNQDVDEKNTCRITAILKTPSGIVVPVANISTATVNLRDNLTGAAIGTADRNVVSYFDSVGAFAYVLSSSDNAIISADTSLRNEDHTLTLKVVFTAGAETHTLIKNIRIRVRNLSYLT